MMLSKQFLKRWNSCTDCGLCRLARSHVIGRGDIPAQLLFIGEALGEKEDLIGKPFVGPAGKLLNRMISESIGGRHHIYTTDPPNPFHFTYYITNLVACAPFKDESRSGVRPPEKEEAEACRERVNDLIEVVEPKGIVYIGQVAKRYHKAPKGMPTITIVHPAAILRSGIAPESSISYHKAIHQLRDFAEKVL